MCWICYRRTKSQPSPCSPGTVRDARYFCMRSTSCALAGSCVCGQVSFITWLPVIAGKLVNMYAVSDVQFLALRQDFNLDMTVAEALKDKVRSRRSRPHLIMALMAPSTP